MKYHLQVPHFKAFLHFAAAALTSTRESFKRNVVPPRGKIIEGSS